MNMVPRTVKGFVHIAHWVSLVLTRSDWGAYLRLSKLFNNRLNISQPLSVSLSCDQPHSRQRRNREELVINGLPSENCALGSNSQRCSELFPSAFTLTHVEDDGKQSCVYSYSPEERTDSAVVEVHDQSCSFPRAIKHDKEYAKYEGHSGTVKFTHSGEHHATGNTKLFCAGFASTKYACGPQHYTCSVPVQRLFHTCVTPATNTTGIHSQCQASQHTPVRHSSDSISRKRIPLAHTEEINEVLEEYAEIIQEFSQVLGCSETEMRDMVRRDTRLVTKYSKHEVTMKMKLLLKNGFQPGEIISNYQVFSRSLLVFYTRLQAMEPVKRYRRFLRLLVLSDAQFRSRMSHYHQQVEVMGRHTSQASFVAELLMWTQEEVEALAEKTNYEFLLTLPPSRLKVMVDFLQHAGLSIPEIRENVLMLRCPPEEARERVRRVRAAGVFKLDLLAYILTNSEEHFSASFASWTRNANALKGYADERELLMNRLQCTEAQLTDMLRKNALVANMTSNKLKSCLDVLQKEIRVSSEAILQHGLLLHYSPERLRSRWALLRSFGLSEQDLVRELLLTERKFILKYGFGSY